MWFLKESTKLIVYVGIGVAALYFFLTFFSGCALVEKHVENFKTDAKLQAAEALKESSKKISEEIEKFCPKHLTQAECEEFKADHKK